jgi:drug/metabolite transporter (DMT)-like permease
VSKPKAHQDFAHPAAGPVLSVRFVLAILLIVGGLAWIAYYYAAVRVDPTVLPVPKSDGPQAIADLKRWNYVIGFAAFFVGLAIAAHPTTPLGRGRGVVVGMLGCFLLGLLWICTFYVISNNDNGVPVFNDLDQYNLMVGIAFMAVGFTYATRWE